MSANAERELGVVAFQLLGTLGEYEEQICTVVDEWPHNYRLERIDGLLRQVQDQSGIFPHLTFAWVQFFASHRELVAKLQGCDGTDPRRFDWLEAHMPAILQLEAKCLDVLARKA